MIRLRAEIFGGEIVDIGTFKQLLKIPFSFYNEGGNYGGYFEARRIPCFLITFHPIVLAYVHDSCLLLYRGCNGDLKIHIILSTFND